MEKCICAPDAKPHYRDVLVGCPIHDAPKVKQSDENYHALKDTIVELQNAHEELQRISREEYNERRRLEKRETELEEKLKESEKGKFDYCITYLDLVEMINYHSPSTYEKIFNSPSKLKLLIERIKTGMVAGQEIKELEEKLSITIDALRDVDNMPCDPKYVLDRFEIINQALIKVGAR
jgi:hypothetical protein